MSAKTDRSRRAAPRRGDPPEQADPLAAAPRATESAMRVGTMLFTPPADGQIDRLQADLNEAGIEIVEISLPITPDAIPSFVARRVEACASRLPGRVQLHEVLPLALAHRHDEFREALLRRLEQDVRLAQSAGIGLITLHTTCTRTRAPLRRDWRVARTRWLGRALDLDVTPSHEESVQTLLAALERLHVAADPPRGPRVVLAVENNFRDTRYFGRRMDAVDDVLDVLRRAALPCARMCFDVFKAQSTEAALTDAIERAGEWIANVHASDSAPCAEDEGRGRTAFFRDRSRLGDGSIAWAGVIAALRRARYAGAIVLEMMSGPPDVRASAAHLRRLLDDRSGDRA